MSTMPQVTAWSIESPLRLEAVLTGAETACLARMASYSHIKVDPKDRVILARLIDPIEDAAGGWGQQSVHARNRLLIAAHDRQRPYWAWDQHEWLALTGTKGVAGHSARLHLVALGMRLGGHRRLHHHAAVHRLGVLGELVFGPGKASPRSPRSATPCAPGV